MNDAVKDYGGVAFIDDDSTENNSIDHANWKQMSTFIALSSKGHVQLISGQQVVDRWLS